MTFLRHDIFPTATIMKNGRLEIWIFCYYIMWSEKKKSLHFRCSQQSAPWWWKFKTIQWISFMGKLILSKFVIVLKTCDIWLALHQYSLLKPCLFWMNKIGFWLATFQPTLSCPHRNENFEPNLLGTIQVLCQQRGWWVGSENDNLCWFTLLFMLT